MLMFDRISSVSESGGAHGRGESWRSSRWPTSAWSGSSSAMRAIRSCAGCLGLDALWQLTGFSSGGSAPRAGALGVGEVKFTGMVLRSVEKVEYIVDMKRVILRRLKLAIADGMLKADGKVIYTASDLRVGLFEAGETPASGSMMPRSTPRERRPASAGNNETAAVTRPLRRNWVETCGRHRDGHRVLDRKLHPGGAGLPARGQVRHRPGGEIRRARLPLPGARRAKIDWQAQVPRKPKRFMEAGVGWNYIAMEQAIRDAGLETKDVVDERTGIIMGEGGPSTRAIVWAADTHATEDQKVGPFEVPKAMCSGPSAARHHLPDQGHELLDLVGLRHERPHCIGNAAELIQWGNGT